MSTKILFIATPSILLYASSIKNCFSDLGYDVYEPEYIKFVDQNPIQKKLNRKNFLTKFFNMQGKKFIEATQQYKPDFIFVINNGRMSEIFLQYCNNNNIPVYMYCIDSIKWCDKALDYMHYYTDIFSYEPSDTKIMFRKNQYVKFIPIGFDSKIYFPSKGSNPPQYDICFVGRLEKRRLEILEQVAKYASLNNRSFIVYTSIQLSNIKHFWLIPKLLVRRIKYNIKYKHLMKCIVNKPIIGKDLVNLYHQSKICLNIHVGTHSGMHTGPNPRTFELLACECFEIIDKGHIEDLCLQNKKDLIEISDIESLISNIDYYLKHDDERRKIAEHGCQTVTKNYELKLIIKQIEKYINTHMLKD